jgi:hypothetical protein
MMFSLNPMQARDRRVVVGKLRQLARRGLPGLWRLLKNAARLISGRWEYPANAAWWRDALQRAGFRNVTIEMLAHEGGVAAADAPSAGARINAPALRPVDGANMAQESLLARGR